MSHLQPAPSRSRPKFWIAFGVIAGALVVVLALVVANSAGVLHSEQPPATGHNTNLHPDSSGPALRSIPLRPETFGAVGDGVHDDTSALQEAIDKADGKLVQLSANANYLCTRSLLLPSHTTLEGPRSASITFSWTHKGADSGGGFYIGNADQAGGNSDIIISGFSIVGAGSGLPSGPQSVNASRNVPMVRLRSVSSFVVANLDISLAPGISILYQGCTHGRVINNYVHDSGRDGITGTWRHRNLTDILIAGNTIARVGDDGIAVVGTPHGSLNRAALPNDIRIIHNSITGWRRNPNGLLLGRGIALLAVRNVQVVDNTIANSASYGILIRGSVQKGSVNPRGQPWISQRVTLVGNTVLNSARNWEGSRMPPGQTHGTSGIDVADAAMIRLEGNVVQKSKGRDVVVARCRDCSLH